MRTQGFEQFLDPETLKRIQNEFGRFFEGDWAREFSRATSKAGREWYPLADVTMGDSEYKVQLDVPGVAADDIKVTVKQGILSISGTRAAAVTTHSDRPSGDFYRQFTLPDGADETGINASSEHGVLTVIVAINDSNDGARTIPVNG